MSEDLAHLYLYLGKQLFEYHGVLERNEPNLMLFPLVGICNSRLGLGLCMLSLLVTACLPNTSLFLIFCFLESCCICVHVDFVLDFVCVVRCIGFNALHSGCLF